MKQENGDGAQAVRLSRQMLRRGAALAALFGIGMLAVLLARLYRLQISQHDFYESLALEQQLRETKGAAARGSITDTNGNPLAVSATVENVYLSPMEIEADGEDRELIARGLAEILGTDPEALYEKTGRKGSWYVTAARKLEREQADRVRAFKAEHGLKGVRLEADTKRYYPRTTSASRGSRRDTTRFSPARPPARSGRPTPTAASCCFRAMRTTGREKKAATSS